MDITSFSLGISFVVVVGMLTVTVYNLFRVYKMNKEIEGINQSAKVTNELLFRAIEENKTIATTENETLWREFRDLNSKTDSRFDKLIYRIERLEREELGKTRQADELESQKFKFMRKELLKDGI